MNLKNYTSSVDAETTIMRIEKCLISAHANGIQKLYKNGCVSSVTFRIPFQNSDLTIRVPANVERCRESMWQDYLKSTQGRGRKVKEDFDEQATRTAWRLMQDWIEVQISLIHLEQVDLLQVFLPYVVMKGGVSYYDHLVETNYKGLLPERT